jgi:hypothetical protein
VTFGIILAVVAAVGAVVGVWISRRAAGRASGSVKSESTSVGTFSFGVNACASGQTLAPVFFGVELRGVGPGAGAAALRVVDSGDRARLWLYPPISGTGALGIGKASCVRWDVRVDAVDATVSRAKAVSGHLRVDCNVGGGRVTADVDFARCAR